MVRPLRLVLLAGAAALGAVTLAAPPAAAQFVMPWGVWAGPPGWMGGEDDFESERIIPPRVVRRILLAQGYRLATPPRLNDDTVVAVGENAQGQRVRFIIDGYSGQLLRRVALGGRDNFATRNAPDGLSTDNLAPVPAPRGDLGAEPAAPKAKPKRKPNPQSAARKPATEAAPKPQTPAPSQAVTTPQAPAPEAPKTVETPKTIETPKASAAAPAPDDKTPLAPDAATQPRPEGSPAPRQAAVPTAPAPVDKPPLTPEAKAPADAPQTPLADAPQEPPVAKPTDIGPRVQPVAPQARASEPAPGAEAKPTEAKPAEPAAAPTK